MKNLYFFKRLVALSMLIMLCSVNVKANEIDLRITFEGQIIYESADGNLWIINGSTGNFRQITTDADQNQYYFKPKFSPNGQQFAFCRRNVSTSTTTLLISSVAKYEPVQLTNDSSCGYDWSPDGSNIIYGKLVRADTSTTPWRWNNPSGIWIVDVNTKNTYELIPRTDQNPLTPRQWSPNGEWISYEKNVYFEGSGIVQTWRKSDGQRFSPAASGFTEWHPASTKLVFDEVNYVPRQGMGLYLTSPDTNNSQQLIYRHPSYAAFSPRFSFDGEYIAFLRGLPLDTPIFLMLIKPDGSGLVDTHNEADYILDWSPSSRKVLFGKVSANNGKLLIYDQNSSSTTLLASNAKAYGRADWGKLPPTYKILGQVLDPNGHGIEGVTISDGQGHTTVTGQFGAYRFDDLSTGTYTLTASKDKFTFAPSERRVNVPPDIDKQDFLGTDKPPIVFVHGWNGLSKDQVDPTDYFKITDELLRTSGYYIGYAKLDSSSSGTPHIQDNVALLKAAIDEAIKATEQKKVILIAHSMGGIVSRAYIEDPALGHYEGDVRELFTIGSPHRGISLRAVGYLLNEFSIVEYITSNPEFCWMQAGVCDMSEINMWLFNRKHYKRPDVKYHFITGDAPYLSRNIIGKGMDAFIPGADDGLVSVASGKGLTSLTSGIGLKDVEDRAENDEVHSLLFGDQYYFLRNGSWSNTFTKCLEPVLGIGKEKKETCEANSGLTSAESQTTDISQSSTRTPLQTGTILPNQTITRTIPVRNTPVLFTVKWLAGDLSVTLRDPAGQLIDSMYANNHPDLVQYQSDSSIAIYSAAQPLSGAWQLVLKADSTIPVTGTTYSTFAAFDEPVQFSAGTDKLWYAPNSSMVISATINPAPIQADVAATIVYAGGSDVVHLTSIGNGQFQGTYTVPTAPGYAEILFEATGLNGQNAMFEYGADALIQFSSTKFQLANTYKDYQTLPTFPFTRLFSDLSLDVGINATSSGVIELSADLVGADGKLITNALLAQSILAGSNSVTLHFNGERIYSSGIDGPYQVRNVLVTDNSTITIIADSKDQAYTTGFYNHKQFKLPTVYLPIIHSINTSSGTTQQNNPPYVPTNLSPVNNATVVNTNVILNWQGGDPDRDTVVYDVYLEANDDTPDELISNGQSNAFYQAGGLAQNTRYYWHIVTRDGHGLTTTGPVWSFVISIPATSTPIPTSPLPATSTNTPVPTPMSTPTDISPTPTLTFTPIPTTISTPTPTYTSTPVASATLLSTTLLEECKWQVDMKLSGFSPHSQITISTNYTELVCATGETRTDSWSGVYHSAIDANGDLIISYLHGGTGSYTYSFTDQAGRSATLLFNTSPELAFVSERDGNAEIYTMRIDGTGLTRLTNNSFDDGNPTWSPDGSKIVFHSDHSGRN